MFTFVSEPVRSLWAHPFAYNGFVLLVSYCAHIQVGGGAVGVWGGAQIMGGGWSTAAAAAAVAEGGWAKNAGRQLVVGYGG